MFPHEQLLVRRLADKPFVLLGINGDDQDPKVKEKNEQEKITWRSFKNDRGQRGSIAEEWGLQGWPTLYVLDHKGVIRHKWLGNPGDQALDDALDRLVLEAEADGGKDKP